MTSICFTRNIPAKVIFLTEHYMEIYSVEITNAKSKIHFYDHLFSFFLQVFPEYFLNGMWCHFADIITIKLQFYWKTVVLVGRIIQLVEAGQLYFSFEQSNMAANPVHNRHFVMGTTGCRIKFWATVQNICQVHMSQCYKNFLRLNLAQHKIWPNNQHQNANNC